MAQWKVLYAERNWQKFGQFWWILLKFYAIIAPSHVFLKNVTRRLGNINGQRQQRRRGIRWTQGRVWRSVVKRMWSLFETAKKLQITFIIVIHRTGCLSPGTLHRVKLVNCSHSNCSLSLNFFICLPATFLVANGERQLLKFQHIKTLDHYVELKISTNLSVCTL